MNFLDLNMTDFLQARANMVDCQIHTSGIVDSKVLNSFGSVPRELFVPEKIRDIAYADESLDIGQGRFLLEPAVHAKMVQETQPKPDDVVLDIGCASGYSSAILSPIVTTIIALENNKRQMDKATRLWNQLGTCNIALIEGDLAKGVADQSPYSLIIINGAVTKVPEAILEQLSVGGRLVTIIKKQDNPIGHATLFMKSDNGSISSKPLFDANAPFIGGFEQKTSFEF